nr:MAG TPA: hypothetical protein [Caudoviricetes sp.]
MKNTTNHTHRLKLPPNFYPKNGLIPYRCTYVRAYVRTFYNMQFLLSPYFVPLDLIGVVW